MRILHADTDDLANPLRGGQPIRTYEVNSRLSKHHEITVFTATYGGCARRLWRGNIEYRRLGLTIPGLGLSPHLSYLASLGMAVRRTPHDLVVEEFTPPIGFGLLPWWTRKPVVCIVQWFSFKNWERRYKLPFERIMRAVSRRGGYRSFIVQTQRMRQYFEALAPTARVWSLGCGVGDDLFQAPGQDGDYVLFLGRLDLGEKGVDLLIEAWEQIREAGVVVPLRIVGEGPGHAYLQRQIMAKGLGDSITLLGRFEGEQKRDALHRCAFVVMPSRLETFGMVAVEAMAASKPVVAFDIDHLNEILRPDWSVLAGAPDACRLAASVVRLWREPAMRRALGERAYRAAQPYRWDAVARRQDEIYRDVVRAGA